MITKKEWKDFLKEKNDLEIKQNTIENHITKSLRVIFRIYAKMLDTWYYPGAAEGDMGKMHIYSNCILIETIPCDRLYTELKYKDTFCSVDFSCEYPIHFLYMSVDEIKEKVSGFVEKQKITDLIKGYDNK